VQELANTAWSCASLRYRNKRFMFDLAREATRKVGDFDLRGLVKIAWSFAQLLIPHKPFLQALAASSLPMISQFTVPELENMAWSLSALYFRHERPSSTVPERVLAHTAGIRAVDFTSLAWAFARIRIRDDPLLDAISASSIPTISELTPQGFANLSWSDAILTVGNTPLLHATSSEAIKKLGDFSAEAQYLVMVADLDLPCASILTDAVDRLIDRLFGAALEVLDLWPERGLLPFFREQPLRSLGAIGTRLLLARMRIPGASAQFCADALSRIHAAHTLSVREPPVDKAVGDLMVEKTWTFAAYNLIVAVVGDTGAGCICRGDVVKDNGFKNARASLVLRPAEMYVYEWVDRAQCGEYQVLAEICELVGRRVDLRSLWTRAAVSGVVEVFILNPPCLSCMSCFRQFQLLLPSVRIHISIGRSAFMIRV